ncbi:hypothetical protein RIR_jg27957.t3 [Rhizophagus irregularis DAOM 181602=DAOM 197198]|nr:hypothetical protein RIR_jg27957.t3 [Rhizophagus irregularis DAOM 181602=DAOM 197198]
MDINIRRSIWILNTRCSIWIYTSSSRANTKVYNGICGMNHGRESFDLLICVGEGFREESSPSWCLMRSAYLPTFRNIQSTSVPLLQPDLHNYPIWSCA